MFAAFPSSCIWGAKYLLGEDLPMRHQQLCTAVDKYAVHAPYTKRNGWDIIWSSVAPSARHRILTRSRDLLFDIVSPVWVKIFRWDTNWQPSLLWISCTTIGRWSLLGFYHGSNNQPLPVVQHGQSLISECFIFGLCYDGCSFDEIPNARHGPTWIIRLPL